MMKILIFLLSLTVFEIKAGDRDNNNAGQSLGDCMASETSVINDPLAAYKDPCFHSKNSKGNSKKSGISGMEAAILGAAALSAVGLVLYYKTSLFRFSAVPTLDSPGLSLGFEHKF